MKAKQKLYMRSGSRDKNKPNPVKPAPKPTTKKQQPAKPAAKKLSLKEQIEQARAARLIAQGKASGKIDPLSYAASKQRIRRKFDNANQAATAMERKKQKQAEREAKKKARQELREAKKAEREKRKAEKLAAKLKTTHNFRVIRKQEEGLLKKYGIGSFIYDAPIPKEWVPTLVKQLEEYAARQEFLVKVVAANGDGIVLQDALPRPRTPNWMGQYLAGLLAGMASK